MVDQHDPAIPLAIEGVVARLRELEVVLGPHARPRLDRVNSALVEAMAARDRGEAAGVIAKIGEAMDHLTLLADQLDPAEAMLMRGLAQRFRTALLHGDQSEARHVAGVMFERSGAKMVKKQ